MFQIKLNLIPLVSVFMLVGLVPTAFAQTSSSEVIQNANQVVPNQVIVKFKEGKDKLAGKKDGEINGIKYFDLKRSGSQDTYLLNLNREISKPRLGELSKRSVEEAESKALELNQVVLKLKSNPDVESVQVNAIYSKSAIPNDTFFADQWGLNSAVVNGGVNIDINAPEAWDITTGSPETVIAVIDSGVDYNHPDLSSKILRKSNGSIWGYDFVNSDADPMDDDGHGTHVAGIAAATSNNGLGIAGMCQQCKIMPLKFLDNQGYGDSFGAISAIYYAADNGAEVINNSWGGEFDDPIMQEAIDYAASKGAVTLAAAGNSNVTTPNYPAAMNNVISVSAVSQGGTRASFSNFGPSIEIAGPSESVSTFPAGTNLGASCSDLNYSTANDGYGRCMGTSMSTPFVSGCVGLIKSIRYDLGQTEIENLLKTTAKDLGSAGRDDQFGFGLLNCQAALNAVKDCPADVYTVQYYRGTNLSGIPARTCGTNSLNINWAQNAVPELGIGDQFSARFVKKQTFTAGVKTFKIRADNWARVYVDDNLVVSSEGRPMLKTYSGQINLVAGEHTIRVEMAEGFESARVKLTVQ
ncbi:MAG: hypothetical protein OHK0017_01590 [Patescibacteria group bacterium]